MNCTRCQGMMVREVENRWFGVGHIEDGPNTLRRCVNCGNVEDVRILQNRRSCGENLERGNGRVLGLPARVESQERLSASVLS